MGILATTTLYWNVLSNESIAIFVVISSWILIRVPFAAEKFTIHGLRVNFAARQSGIGEQVALVSVTKFTSLSEI